MHNFKVWQPSEVLTKKQCNYIKNLKTNFIICKKLFSCKFWNSTEIKSFFQSDSKLGNLSKKKINNKQVSFIRFFILHLWKTNFSVKLTGLFFNEFTIKYVKTLLTYYEYMPDAFWIL
jgi:hypothetical protein